MRDAATRPPLSALSRHNLLVWVLQCLFVPLALLLAGGKGAAGSTILPAVLTLAGVIVGIAYAARMRSGWYGVQACMLAGVFLGGYFSNRVLFVGEAAAMIYLSFSLYAREVREEFGVHAAPREIGVLVVLLAMCMVLALVRPHFLDQGRLLDLVRQFSMVGIMAVGMTMVIALGGIDLSVGSVVGLSGCLAMLAYAGGAPLWAAVLVALAVGGACGSFNGGLVSRFRMPPFIITLGTMTMARSLANVVTGGKPVVLDSMAREGALRAIAWSDTLGVPNPVWIMALAVIAGHVFMTRMRTGRHVYYIGANEEAARLSGLNVVGVKWLVYGVCGALAGLAGMVQAARVASGQPTAGMGDELRVIAAVIIGGASFAGGEGTVLGAVLGAAIMGVLRQGLVLLGVEPFWQGFVQGAVIIGAVALDMLRRRR